MLTVWSHAYSMGSHAYGMGSHAYGMGSHAYEWYGVTYLRYGMGSHAFNMVCFHITGNESRAESIRKSSTRQTASMVADITGSDDTLGSASVRIDGTIVSYREVCVCM